MRVTFLYIFLYPGTVGEKERPERCCVSRNVTIITGDSQFSANKTVCCCHPIHPKINQVLPQIQTLHSTNLIQADEMQKTERQTATGRQQLFQTASNTIRTDAHKHNIHTPVIEI